MFTVSQCSYKTITVWNIGHVIVSSIIMSNKICIFKLIITSLCLLFWYVSAGFQMIKIGKVSIHLFQLLIKKNIDLYMFWNKAISNIYTENINLSKTKNKTKQKTNKQNKTKQKQNKKKTLIWQIIINHAHDYLSLF